MFNIFKRFRGQRPDVRLDIAQLSSRVTGLEQESLRQRALAFYDSEAKGYDGHWKYGRTYEQQLVLYGREIIEGPTFHPYAASMVEQLNQRYGYCSLKEWLEEQA